ncbi:uncharacterized protein [Amphiura filiformis]|uniref:uncharacterized protein n=1 Tax=Amphiura filiformis TaxID=82378 RepID=UPI003B219E93
MTWRNRKVRLLLYGDCEFICKSYGILGCNALYACPYCEGSYSEWQVPLKGPGELDGRDPFPVRSLQSLADDYARYTADGSAKPRAKLVSKSIVREPHFQLNQKM